MIPNGKNLLRLARIWLGSSRSVTWSAYRRERITKDCLRHLRDIQECVKTHIEIARIKCLMEDRHKLSEDVLNADMKEASIIDQKPMVDASWLDVVVEDSLPMVDGISR